MDNTAIKVEAVSKDFKLPHEKSSSIKSAVVNFYRHDRGYEMQKALENISFQIEKGEFFGIVGRNGSGKSTLLKLLAGIYTPTSGNIQINGSLTPFIELGVGFNAELTGRENVYLNGALLGFNRKEVQAMYRDIVAFAELENFMDQKLKNYSSGMQVRLAFSIAIRVKSDILLIDEVLAVGDLAFQEKCYKYFEEVKHTGKTVILVSHDSGAVQKFCNRTAIIDKGRLVDIGDSQEMLLKYGAIVAEEQISSFAKKALKKEQRVKGRLQITKARVVGQHSGESSSIKSNEPFLIEVFYKLNKPIKEKVTIGVDIIDAESERSILGPNTREAKKPLNIKKSGSFIASFPSNPLSPKLYTVTAGIFNEQETYAYDLAQDLLRFKILGDPRHGSIYIEPEWELKESK